MTDHKPGDPHTMSPERLAEVRAQVDDIERRMDACRRARILFGPSIAIELFEAAKTLLAAAERAPRMSTPDPATEAEVDLDALEAAALGINYTPEGFAEDAVSWSPSDQWSECLLAITPWHALSLIRRVREAEAKVARVEATWQDLADYDCDRDPYPRAVDVPDDYEMGIHEAADRLLAVLRGES